jgi:hypothetical protein
MKVAQTREAVTMKVAQKRRWKILLVAGATMALVAGMASTVPSAYAGGTIKADDDHWISIGMGTRMSFNAIKNASPDGQDYTNSFQIDNARIYINGQVHKYLKFTFNTECFNCSVGGGAGFAGNANIGLIDAIGKIEYNQYVNFWFGRTLVPTERGELNGPFYHPTYDGFRTPFFPNDQNKISLQMRQEFEQRKSQLLDEIGKLEMEEAGLTSIERIHEIVQALQMVQPTEPVQALQEDAVDSGGNNEESEKAESN